MKGLKKLMKKLVILDFRPVKEKAKFAYDAKSPGSRVVDGFLHTELDLAVLYDQNACMRETVGCWNLPRKKTKQDFTLR